MILLLMFGRIGLVTYIYMFIRVTNYLFGEVNNVREVGRRHKSYGYLQP